MNMFSLILQFELIFVCFFYRNEIEILHNLCVYHTQVAQNLYIFFMTRTS